MKQLIKTAALIFTTTLMAQANEAPQGFSKPLITYTAEKDATGDTKAVYEEIKNAYGIVPEPIKALSLNPKLLRNKWESYKLSGENENFSPKMTAMMRLLVAEKNDCTFCVGFNKGMLLNVFKLSLDEIGALQKDPTNAKLEPKQKEMLSFMLKSANNPHSVTKKDISTLKELGWSQTDIMEGAHQATEMVATALFIDTFKIQ
ncbi:MAG TPA: hypothetical protein EYG95_00295 [Campylobacterales bacterium]|nr:hypothetical protein [Campylobacterales bacterium]